MKTTQLLIATAAIIATVACTVSIASEPVRPETPTADEAPTQPRHVDLAICLDTSGSMSGLIESAKQKLWAVVNELAEARPRPVLRVALYQYGNDGLNSENGWVQQLSPLTDDLDAIYGKLFELTTNGGSEYVARVMRAATTELEWSEDRNALRIMFIAGNEPATQDPTHKLQDTCKAAASRGVIVNTIHCGDEATGRNTGWEKAAVWADGQYAAIDQDGGTVTVQTPYDKKLAELSSKLNETYVAYGGAEARERMENQKAQDVNATLVSAPASAERASAKASGLYRNADWDLVDAVAEEEVDVAEVDVDQLPEEMKGMTAEQRKAYVAEQAERRAEIQEEIRSLGEKRDAYVQAEREKQGLSDDAAFDAALRRAVRDQASKSGFKFGDAAQPELESDEAPADDASQEAPAEQKGE